VFLSLLACDLPSPLPRPSAGIGQCIASRFVSGRVLLAGDACHTHSSGSAQGLNTGAFDATNLAWKLAMVIKGHARSTLLESYHAERWALVQQVIENDKTIATLISGKLPPRFAGRMESPRDLLTEWFKNADNVAVSGLPAGTSCRPTTR
jgi:phenol 2-monooxygenase